MGNCRVPSIATDQSQLGLLSSEAGLCQGEDSHIPIPAGIALVTFVTFPRTMSQTQSQLGLLRGGPGSCRWVQPQTNPSWDCSRHICDVPTSYCHRPNPSWDCFEGDAAYAGKYSHRSIPAGIARVSLGKCRKEANHYLSNARQLSTHNTHHCHAGQGTLVVG